MAWVTPSSRTTGDVISAANWNQDVVANAAYLKGQAGAVTALENGLTVALTLVVSGASTLTGAVATGGTLTTAGALTVSSGGVTITAGALTLPGYVDLTGIAAPAAPTGAVTRVYVATDGTLRYQTATSGDLPVGSSGAAKAFLLGGM